jgi:hypothetical protein
MGFLFAEQFIITATHVLPTLPSIPNQPGDEAVPVYVISHKAGAAARVAATTSVYFADVHSDLAILYNPCEEFATALGWLPLRLDDIPSDEGLFGNIFTCRGEWKRALVSLWQQDDPSFCFLDGVPGGTSGAPVFDDSGCVMGIVSASNGGRTTAVYLLNTLPGRMARIARQQNREQG